MSSRLRHITRMISTLILLLLVSMSSEGGLSGRHLRAGWERETMPRGAPDYSNVRSAAPLHRLDDMAELAARLGCLTIYDRPGNVVWLQSFESGLQGSTFGTGGVDSEGTLVSSRSIHGAFSIKLDPGDGDGDYVEWRTLVYYFPVGKTGFEVSLSPDTDFENIRFTCLAYDGTHVLRALIRYYPDGGIWKLYNDEAAYETIASDIKLQQGATAWHPVKLVIDTENEKYIRLQIDQHVIDLTEYGLRKSANVSLAQLEVSVTVFGDADTHAPCYFDRFIVTQNEP